VRQVLPDRLLDRLGLRSAGVPRYEGLEEAVIEIQRRAAGAPDGAGPILESFPLTAGSYAVKRYGAAEAPDSRQVGVDLDAAG
jgi:hypothetical protein